MSNTTHSEIDDQRSPKRDANNLDGLRLLGALAVIYGHSFVLRGDEESNPTLAGASVQTFGVFMFFSISGYLIAASWNRRPSFGDYMRARCLRIFPALWVVIGASVLIIGPLATTVRESDYFARKDTWTYAGNAMLRFQSYLPGVWESVPDSRMVNGSLWTLAIEFCCYVFLPLIMFVPRVARILLLVVLLSGAVAFAFVQDVIDFQVWNVRVEGLLRMGPYFAAGAILRALHVQRRDLFRTDLAVVFAIAHFVLAARFDNYEWQWGWILLPYVILAVGLASTPVIRRSSRFGDLSYGLYLWGYPVQQAVVAVLGVIGVWSNMALVLGVTGALAFASWHLVEKRALSFKRPGDRVAVSESR